MTTDHVLIETSTLLHHRLGRRVAEGFWEGLRSGAAAIVDRTSFAVMRRLGIERGASFEDHFAIFRFGPNRRRAFTVIR